MDLHLENRQLRADLQDLREEFQMLQDSVTAATKPRYGQYCDLEPGDLGSEHWVHRLRPDVRCLPRLWTEILPSLDDVHGGNIEVDLHMSPKATASQVLAHAEKSVLQLSSKHPAVFKIGITMDPVARWKHPQYGYSRDRRERWQKMKLVGVFSESFSAGLVEAVLIRRFKDTPGCRNDRPGGETACPGEGPHFTYVTYKVLVPPHRAPARVP